MSILRMSPLIPPPPPSRNLSSIGFSTHQISRLSIHPITPFRPPTTIIRMGGGPRTFPGGVSKWQWKRMQAKKQKQLLKARLCRERQIYEMRKRAELKSAVSELERPWEVVKRAPTLFSVSADEQLKTLADRFQRPGGYDLWSERDGPQLFHTVDGLPSARFLPKGAVHSVKPYGVRGNDDSEEEESERRLYNGNRRRLRSKGLNNGNRDVEGGLNNLRISSGRVEREVHSVRQYGIRHNGNLEDQNDRESSNGDRRRWKGKATNDQGSGEFDNESLLRNGREEREFHSARPYGIRRNGNLGDQNDRESYNGNRRTSRGKGINGRGSGGFDNEAFSRNGREERAGQREGKGSPRGSLRSKGPRWNGVDSKQSSYDKEKSSRSPSMHRGRTGSNVRDQWKSKVSRGREVYDMSLKQDGSYELQHDKSMLLSGGFEDDFEVN